MRERKEYSKLVTNAANDYIGYPPEHGEGIEVYMQRKAFKEGACWMERKMLDLDIPDYPKEIVEKEIKFVNKCLADGIRPTFAGAIQYALTKKILTSDHFHPSLKK